MTPSRKRLSHDREVLHYLDALDAGDLEAVAAAWERASTDPELEAMLREVDQELAAGNGSLVHGRLETVDTSVRLQAYELSLSNRRRWRRTTGVICALAAACLLALLAWKGLPGDRGLKEENKVLLTGSTASNDDASALPMVVQSNSQGSLTHFAWPVEERSPLRVGSAVPPDLLN